MPTMKRSERVRPGRRNATLGAGAGSTADQRCRAISSLSTASATRARTGRLRRCRCRCRDALCAGRRSAPICVNVRRTQGDACALRESRCETPRGAISGRDNEPEKHKQAFSSAVIDMHWLTARCCRGLCMHGTSRLGTGEVTRQHESPSLLFGPLRSSDCGRASAVRWTAARAAHCSGVIGDARLLARRARRALCVPHRDAYPRLAHAQRGGKPILLFGAALPALMAPTKHWPARSRRCTKRWRRSTTS